ncbi:DUF3108 domain-containing protein [Ideonella sp. BN130291]|uniref:DUF3108 domain-containing protein n=1 Tax=Ideonella sp. BN130291 TaxID=3112940 RepID=UPI002E2723BC|nr:DUF3108 domain-containing protein [Ideonella sp. BN130291]
MAAGLTPEHGTGRRWRRRAAWLLLLLAVVSLHGWVTDELAEDRFGWGAADSSPTRMEVAFVRELAQAAPPAGAQAPAVARAPRRSVAASPEPAASQAQAEAAPEVAQAPDVASSASPPESPASQPPSDSVQVAEVSATAASAPDIGASAPAAPPFEWPPSTRLSYLLTGNYQGPVEGSARVQWIRSGNRYQVHLDVIVGLSVAPLMQRQMTSDGELSEQGLKPQRYHEDTRVAFQPPRHATVRFEDDRVVLANGSTRPRPEGVQDTASQLVQLTWLFTTQPQRLQVGQSVEVPLALPRRVDRWTYDVVEADTLYTAFGQIPVMHVKPRRIDSPQNVLTVESWIAPTLQYLPVRVRIEQSAEVYVDLMLERAPQQAAP